MRPLLMVSFRSLLNRKLTTSLSILSILISTFLLISIERVKKGAEDSFAGVISGTDFVVGAPGSQLNILLYSVFHMGESIKNISWKVFQEISNDPRVAWAVPLSLGDSHQGFRVIATESQFFEHYKYRKGTSLEFLEGSAWSTEQDSESVVIGYEVYRKLQYRLQEPIVLTHGLEPSTEQNEHKDHPFRVAGVLKKTGTPVDRGLYISLQGMEKIHVGWDSGMAPSGGAFFNPSSAEVKSITSLLVGLNDRRTVMHFGRALQTQFSEPLMGSIPGVTLAKFWQNLDVFEMILKVMGFLVAVSGILGISISLLTSLSERRREMSILRSLGATPQWIFLTLFIESQILTLAGILGGFLASYLGILLTQPLIERIWGLSLPVVFAEPSEFLYMFYVWLISLFMALGPSLKAQFQSVHDGLTQKI
jgi:putative ABC transport system permease protein